LKNDLEVRNNQRKKRISITSKAEPEYTRYYPSKATSCSVIEN
jgi:hypothetical protein